MSGSSQHQTGDGPGADRWGVSTGAATRPHYWWLSDRWDSTGGISTMTILAWTALTCRYKGQSYQEAASLEDWALAGPQAGTCASMFSRLQLLLRSWPGKSHHWFQQHLQPGPGLTPEHANGQVLFMRRLYMHMAQRYINPLHFLNCLLLLPAHQCLL